MIVTIDLDLKMSSSKEASVGKCRRIKSFLSASGVRYQFAPVCNISIFDHVLSAVLQLYNVSFVYTCTSWNLSRTHCHEKHLVLTTIFMSSILRYFSIYSKVAMQIFSSLEIKIRKIMHQLYTHKMRFLDPEVSIFGNKLDLRLILPLKSIAKNIEDYLSSGVTLSVSHW